MHTRRSAAMRSLFRGLLCVLVGWCAGVLPVAPAWAEPGAVLSGQRAGGARTMQPLGPSPAASAASRAISPRRTANAGPGVNANIRGVRAPLGGVRSRAVGVRSRAVGVRASIPRTVGINGGMMLPKDSNNLPPRDRPFRDTNGPAAPSRMTPPDGFELMLATPPRPRTTTLTASASSRPSVATSAQRLRTQRTANTPR